MTVLLAHQGRPVTPHDAWSAWNADGYLLVTLLAGGAVYAWGLRRAPDGGSARSAAAVGALAALMLALVSPLDALARSLASAHMVQHVLLIVVAAPLLAVAAPVATALRALPAGARRLADRVRRIPALAAVRRAVMLPAVAWAAHAGVLWAWHSGTLYDAAVRNHAFHVLQHALLLGTGVVFWSTVVGPRRDRVPAGLGILLVFTMALQSVGLAALLTFSPVAWYSAYAATTQAWGLTPLADQQLAGVIMWVPAGFIYVAAALALLGSWLRESERAPNVAASTRL